MAEIIYSDITLDVSGVSLQHPLIRVKQNDRGTRGVRVTILNDKSPFVISDGEEILINFKRTNDQRVNTYEGTLLQDGRVQFTIPSWALEYPYTVKCDISIVERDNDDYAKLTTNDFYIQVEETTITNSDQQDDDTINYLDKLIQEVGELSDNYDDGIERIENFESEFDADIERVEDLEDNYNAGIIRIEAAEGIISGFSQRVNTLETGKADKTITITGTGVLSGGGDLSQNRTITHNEILGTAKTTADVYKIKIDKYGHITEAVSAGLAAVATSGSYNDLSDQPAINNGTLTIQVEGTSKGTFTANQAGNTTINITAASLGLSSAMKFIGTTTTQISDGATTNPVTINGSSVTATGGNVVLYNNKEFLWNSSLSTPAWEELGDESSHALKTVTITGIGVLGGGGSLEANRTITHNAGNAVSKASGFYKFSTDAYSHIGGVTAVVKKDLTDLITSMAAASGGSDLSLVTTGEKYAWNTAANKVIIELEENGSATAGTWLASTDKITSLEDGQLFLYKIAVAGASTTTLNITANGTELGAKTIYRVGTTKLTTQYGVGQYLLLIYNTTNTCFRVINDSDANSYAYVRQYQSGDDAAGSGTKYPILTRYNLTNKNASYDTAYSRYHTDVTIDTSNGNLDAPSISENGTPLSSKYLTSHLTSINGLSGGQLTSALYLAGGDAVSGAANIQLDTDGQITAKGTTSTLFGRSNSTTLLVGHSSHALTLRGSATRPTYNGNALALSSDIPSAVTESTVSGWGFTKNTGTVTSVRVQAGAGLSSSTSTAQTTSLNTTISIADGYKLPTTTDWSSVFSSSNLPSITNIKNSAGNTFTSAKVLTAKSHSGWSDNSADDRIIPTMSFIAYWNGAYNASGNSNLTYCNQGAFGDMATKTASNYATLASPTFTGTVDTSGATLKIKTINAPTASGGTTYGAGSNGQILKSNGTTVYWASDNNSDTKVNVTLATTTKAYLLATSTTPTSTAAAVTSLADTGVYLGTTAGSLYATNIYASSDERLKENIKPVELDCGEVIEKLKIKEFNFKADEEKKIIVGAIAQELKAILPKKYQSELIGGSEQDYYSINEGKLLYVAIGALKDEMKKVASLEKKVALIEAQLGA